MSSRSFMRRRKLFISDSIQPDLLRRLLAAFGSVIIISAIAFFVLSSQEVSSEYYSAHSQLKNTRDMFVPWLIGVNLVALLLATAFLILPSHKIAGPIYHLQRDLESIKEGIFPKAIKVRKNDSLQDFAACMSSSMKSVSGQIALVQDDLLEIGKMVDEISRQGKASPDQIERLSRQVDDSMAHAKFFKTNS